MNTGETGTRDFLQVIRIATTQPAVMQADQGKAARARFLNSNFARAVNRIQTGEVAAVDLRRDRCFVHDHRRATRFAHTRMFGHGEDARQPQCWITAQLGIHQMRSDDASLVS